MKTNKSITLLLLFSAFFMTSFGQKATEKNETKQTKIEKNKIPTVVTGSYYSEYPGTYYENWYGYPEFNYENEWYGYDPFLRETYSPEYYVVEFTKEKTRVFF